jgi:hypothetical protein
MDEEDEGEGESRSVDPDDSEEGKLETAGEGNVSCRARRARKRTYVGQEFPWIVPRFTLTVIQIVMAAHAALIATRQLDICDASSSVKPH